MRELSLTTMQSTSGGDCVLDYMLTMSQGGPMGTAEYFILEELFFSASDCGPGDVYPELFAL